MVRKMIQPALGKRSQERSRIRAAEYVRMSTEHQQYSADNQSLAINLYAEQHGFEIVKTYSDEGKSGLHLKGRFALQKLLADIEQGNPDYEAILIYDISRLGRFQDIDEAAYCELRCRRAGISVHYCAEQFENDGSIGSSILKAVKRAMASEYSRELSVKVFAGQANLVRRGYRLGGTAGYGVRRLLVDINGVAKAVLRCGERKSISTDRIVLIPGPDEECAIVREIFELFVHGRKSELEIAVLLNERGVLTDVSKRWTRALVNSLLTNEKYIGNNVWAMTSFKLGTRCRRIRREDWIRADGVFAVIVDPALFARAGALIKARLEYFTNGEMLDLLRDLLETRGFLTSTLIDQTGHIPGSGTYRKRFGSLRKAYDLVGFRVARDYAFLDNAQCLRSVHASTLIAAVAGIEAVGGVVTHDPATNLLTINREFTASVFVARCYRTESGSYLWKIPMVSLSRPDIMIVARMGGDNENLLDYYLFPQLDVPDGSLRLFRDNRATIDAYRFVNLGPLFKMAERSPMRSAA